MFLFTHIEKCAGQSFSSTLQLTFPTYMRVTKNHFGGNDRQNDLAISQFKKLNKFWVSGIGGHCVRPYINFQKHTNKSLNYITFLRNPVERYMSQYNHDREMGFTRDFEHFLSRDYMVNFMVNKIAGENNLNNAYKLIDKYVFIGDTDRYQKSLNYLSDILNCRFYNLNENVNERKNNPDYLSYSDLSRKEKLIVEERNKLDIKLYERCVINNNEINIYKNTYDYKVPNSIYLKLINKIESYNKKKLMPKVREKQN
jgi:hypothetical protein